MLVFATSQAQWVNDPTTNTFVANTSADAGEIYLATNPITGDTYLQWTSFVGGNGWSPNLQRLDFEGVPQWGANGIHIAGHQFSSMSEGVAMATTTDGGVVSCFAVYDGATYAVKIDPDGNFPWGEQGKLLFGGLGFSRAEIIATEDGGVWALGSDYSNLYLQYLNEVPSPVITIADNNGKSCMFGKLTLGQDNKVFVTYEKLGNGFYTDKSIYVAGYNTDGSQFSPETMLMSPRTFQSTYIHTALSDGMGGGYAYIWHSGIGDSFNVYIFHFDEDGVSTITSTDGASVHELNPEFYYTSAYGTIDPNNHDLLVVYEQIDSYSQTLCSIFINRITPNGEKKWGDGILVADNGNLPCGGYRIDAFENGEGFTVIYHKGLSQTSTQSTVEAHGFDIEGKKVWSTQMCSNPYSKTGDENSTGFHGGQNIVAWVNASSGGLYAQNIQPNGMMGPIPTGCPGPTGFQGEYQYNPEDGSFGALLTWDQPEEEVEFYKLYCTDLGTGEMKEVEIGGADNFYFDPSPVGRFNYQLRAQWAYLDCGLSLPATTPDGQDHVSVTVTAIPEASEAPMVTLLGIYTLTGQRLQGDRLETLSRGVYVLEGLAADGKHIHRKIAVTQE